MVFVFLYVFIFKNETEASFLPPHEFAYGTTLNNIEELPEKIDRFLSLEVLDPNKIQIETFVGLDSDKNLKPLISYITSQKNADLKP